MKKRKEQKKAFTIIEFMLAMTFLAILLMGIATLTMRVLEIYRKGLALRAVNATGRDILNDLSRVVSGSPIVEKVNPKAQQNSTQITAADIKKAWRNYYNEVARVTTNSNGNTVQTGGVFCTGMYSYVWNTAPTIAEYRESGVKNNAFTINDTVYKFARFPDNERTACERQNEDSSALKTTHFTYSPANGVVSLIADDDTDLAIYDMVVLPATQNDVTGQIFYSGSFILATMRGGINILTNGDFCTGTEQMYSTTVEASNQDFNYCAVNKFNFAVRATGESRDTNQYGER